MSREQVYSDGEVVNELMRCTAGSVIFVFYLCVFLNIDDRPLVAKYDNGQVKCSGLVCRSLSPGSWYKEDKVVKSR